MQQRLIRKTVSRLNRQYIGRSSCVPLFDMAIVSSKGTCDYILTCNVIRAWSSCLVSLLQFGFIEFQGTVFALKSINGVSRNRNLSNKGSKSDRDSIRQERAKSDRMRGGREESSKNIAAKSARVPTDHSGCSKEFQVEALRNRSPTYRVRSVL
jgi:hypothetical protein